MNEKDTWLLEKHALGELSTNRPLEAEELELSRTFIEANNALVLERYPAQTMVARIRARADGQPQRRPRHQMLIAAATASLVLLLGLTVVTSPSLSDTRAKGTPSLSVYRQRGGQAERLRDQAKVQAGDIVQLRYFSPDSPYARYFPSTARTTSPCTQRPSSRQRKPRSAMRTNSTRPRRSSASS